jgi:hypothetical protein
MVPKALQDRPILLPVCKKYLDAYFVLNNARGYNESGKQPLEVPAITSYLVDVLDISGVDRKRRYVTLIQAMDRVALNYYYEQAKRARQ